MQLVSGGQRSGRGKTHARDARAETVQCRGTIGIPSDVDRLDDQADVSLLAQAVLLVGTGGVLSLPLGLALARWLESILHAMPEIPAAMHFFAFEPRALATHALLLALTAVLAALYPMRLVSRLPIAATLRNEMVT